MGANAQTSVPAFTAGQVLTAAQVTQINTGIPVFADSTARDAAFGGTGEKTLAEGQMAYLEDTNQTQVYDGAAWGLIGGKILQVVSTTKTDTFSASVADTATTSITGLTATITPNATSSTILILVMLTTGSGGFRNAWRLTRSGTDILQGDSAGNRHLTTTAQANPTGTIALSNLSISGVDSPATTSAITYGVDWYNSNGSAQTVNVNRSSTDTDNDDYGRGVSTITVMEVSA